ncbi:MAG: tRNA dihydrouridine(20/20a) synthase DusA, partial [Gammaproteobacteria bacterium]
VTTAALIHGDRDRLLEYHEMEHPVALQLGGSVPEELAACTRMAEEYGYDEVNLNLGCPSDRVQSGRFGACLMSEPDHAARCVQAMAAAASIPVTVKCRIGVDERDSYRELSEFVSKLAAAGCNTFVIHARKAWLKGLSPKQNREIPPLDYDRVYRIKQDFPELEIVINGGIATIDQIEEQLLRCDGVMIGREAYHNPYLLASVDANFYGAVKHESISRAEVVERMIPYIQSELNKGVRLNSIARHMLGLFHGVAGSRGWRRHISEHAHQDNADERVLMDAVKFIRE